MHSQWYYKIPDFQGTVAAIFVMEMVIFMDEIIEVARKHESITTFHLPDGYNTVLSDDGVNISKVKTTSIIARAMLSKSQILILMK